jgi:hypothetical protein
MRERRMGGMEGTEQWKNRGSEEREEQKEGMMKGRREQGKKNGGNKEWEEGKMAEMTKTGQ